MSKTRDNHYVPQWYQRGFLFNNSNQLHYLDLTPDTKQLPSGRVITISFKKPNPRPTSQCFFQTDLYTTFFGDYINDDIEQKLFGEIDNTGAKAVKAFISEDISEWHHNFSDFFSYIDSQKIRTPKGLNWLKNHYPNLGQVELMIEMQAIRNLHCTIWVEGVREIVSAKNSEIKFILSDHPVTIYNYAYPPDCEQCAIPDDPSIALKGTQTLFPLDMDHCLILTNYEYAINPDTVNPTENRTNARPIRNGIARTDAFIRSRFLNKTDIEKINLIIKKRAYRYIAAPKKDWLYPEKNIQLEWSELKKVLLPPEDNMWKYGGEIYVGNKDGSTYYQDAFGRTTPEHKYLKKPKRNEKTGQNDLCGCGSGKKYKKCCRDKNEFERPSWAELSIRERNIIFCNGVIDILGLSKGKTWVDVRKELSNEQVKEIHELYGFLWPSDTDIFSLLPQPDKVLRALYTGIIDLRVISDCAIGLTPYFDEIIIQHPFINPCSVKPEFSPIHSPHQFKQQTLKNVLLLFTLMPFIEAGFINFIPDPCSFDPYLHKQMVNMATERTKNHKLGEKEEELLNKLHREDIQRAMPMLSKVQQISQPSRAMPALSAAELEQTLQYLEKNRLDDPYALLQNDEFDQGGQLLTFQTLPNFEMSLFIAQISGAFLLTDSPYRWEEIKNSQSKQDNTVIYHWEDLSKLINKLEYRINVNPKESFWLRVDGNFGNIRKAFRCMYSAIQDNKGIPNANFIERLKSEFIVGYKTSQKAANKGKYCLSSKFICLIPQGGFVHNNVQRMLLTCGSKNHLICVPMAIFVEQA
jgi:hypothetical protein